MSSVLAVILKNFDNLAKYCYYLHTTLTQSIITNYTNYHMHNSVQFYIIELRLKRLLFLRQCSTISFKELFGCLLVKLQYK